MSSRINSKQFSFSYNELISLSKNLCVVLTRDLTDLSIFGLTADLIEDLSDLTSAFENSRTDIEYEGDVMIKTDAKNAFAEQVLEQIRFMSVRVDAAFGSNSIVYDTFRFSDINILPDNDLLETLKRIIRMAKQYTSELLPFGVTPALLIELEELFDNFSNAMVEQESAIDIRRLATSARIESANQIYELISNYSGFGKKFYSKSNPAKYEDYIIYTPSPSGLDAPTNMLFDKAGKCIQWYPVDNATSYELEKSYDNVNFNEVYSGVDIYYNFDIFEPLVYYRARARNSKGFGPFSETLVCEYIDPLPIPQNVSAVLTGETAVQVSISWSEVRTADQYHVYKCVTNIGSPSGSFVFTQNTQILNVVLNAMSGRRTYYKVRALSYGQQSEFSEEVFVDVVV